MLRHTPIRKPGQNVATLATYTIPEAAAFLAMQSRTLFEWYSGEFPILKPSAHYGAMSLLSFRDLEEAYKVHLLRTKHRFPLQYLRKAMKDAREKSGSDHPLLDVEIDVMDRLALIIPGRGRRRRRAVTLGDPSVPDYFPEVVRAWGRRISKGSKGEVQLFPWRFAKSDDESRPVSLNPEVMSGRLVVTGTRIPVNLLWGRRLSGEPIESIADDYSLEIERVRQALIHIDQKVA